MRISDWSSDVCSSDLQRGIACSCAVASVDGGGAAMSAPGCPVSGSASGARSPEMTSCDGPPSASGSGGSCSGSQSPPRSEEHTSELQSLMRISYAVFCLKKKTQDNPRTPKKHQSI